MPNGRNSNWTDENIGLLTKLWADGLSASCIAAELPGWFTRSAVIGKVHRLGLDKRKTVTVREGGVDRRVFGARANRPKRDRLTRNYSVLQKFCGDPGRIDAREAEAAVRAEFYAEEVVDLTAEQKARAVTFAQLEQWQCKWPYGDPRKPDFVFCGCDRMPDSPYCEPHHRIGTGTA